VVGLRTEPNTALAPLSHMLMRDVKTAAEAAKVDAASKH
jgi:hypothetical protein